jgi:hypothetical protein
MIKRILKLGIVLVLLTGCQSVKYYPPSIIIPVVEGLTERPNIVFDDSDPDKVSISNKDYYKLIDYIIAVQADYKIQKAKLQYMIDEINNLTDDK